MTADGPVFVVGAPRSGTTLILTMLNRHPDIALCGETYFGYYVLDREAAFGDLSDTVARARAIDAYLATRRAQSLGLDLVALRERLLRDATDCGAMFLALMRFHAESCGKTVFGDKTPHHALAAAELAARFPGARVVHIVRDPRDVVASLRRMPWGQGSVRSDAALWAACVRGAERCAGSPRFLRVRYEDVVARPEDEMARLVGFLGVPPDPRILEASGGTASRWWFDRAQGRVEQGRRERWREELTPAEVQVVEWTAAAEMRAVGYEPACPPAPAGLRLSVLARAAAAAGLRRVRDLPRKWVRVTRPTDLAAEEALLDAPSDGSGPDADG